MNGKIMKKTITASIAVLLIVALAIALACFLNKPVPTTNAAGEFFRATYVSSHGLLTDEDLTADEQGRKHRTKAQESAYLNTAESNILEITTGQTLYEFLNGGHSQYSHAYLAADVSFAYSNATGAPQDYQYKVEKSSSNATFTRVLDGNGYTLSLWGGTGFVSGDTSVTSADNYFGFGGSSTTCYTGFLMAINQGTVKNLTVDYLSNHIAIAAYVGNQGKNNGGGFWSGSDNTESTGLFVSNGSNIGATGGVIAGFNDKGGQLDNVRLNLKSAFKIIDRAGTNGNIYNNFSFAGGLVGRAGGGSSINNCQIDISDSAGVYAGSAGKSTGLFDDAYTLSVAGGLVGRIDQGARSSQLSADLVPAIVQYSAVSGSGKVKAYCASASGSGNNTDAYRKGFFAYAGGAIGACLDIVKADSGSYYVLNESTNKSNHNVDNGQVVGIISDWTGLAQSNYTNVDCQSYGQMFGTVGENAQQTVVLYNLNSFRESVNNTRTLIAGGSEVDNLYLDFASAAQSTSWASIYPTNEGGEVIVRLDGEDMSAIAIADGADVTDAQLAAEAGASVSYEFEQGQTGNIIWRATNGGGTDRINLQNSAPVYAEKTAISSRTTGEYEYTFGRITTISFENTNGDTTARGYQGKSAILNKPNVVSSLGGTIEEYKDSEWTITRNGVVTDISGTSLPGAYRMNVQAEEQTFYPMGYYSEDQKIAAWTQATDYVFTITVGELNYGANTAVEEGWSNSAYFELMMTSADDFDSIKSFSNGQVKNCDFTKTGASAYVTISDSTGKNGMKYTFIAYAVDPATGKDIEVARTKSADDKLVKIDNELPEIGEITYYVKSSSGRETPIAESELSTWRKDRIVAKYNVIDTKSGIKSAPSSANGQKGLSINNSQVKDDGSYDVEVTLSMNTEYTISYQDNVGNILDVKLQANVDYMTTKPAMDLTNVIYNTNAYGYSTSGATIRFNTTIGCSDWQLQYSWQKDANGDIWEDAMAQNSIGANTEDKFIMNNSNSYSFRINWNMGDAQRGGADFKMRMVNVHGLYDTVELSYDDETFVGKYYINYKVANIYVNKALDGVKVSGGDYNGRSLADLMKNLSADALAAFLDKSYDGTDEYKGNVEFVVPVTYGSDEMANPQEFVDENGVGVLYSLAYLARPQNIDAVIKMNIKYDSANAGKVKLTLSFAEVVVNWGKENEEDVSEKYNLYFADFVDANGDKNIDFTDEYEIVADKFISSTRTIENRNINKLALEIDLRNSEVVKGLPQTYYYGEKVPATVQANVPGLKDAIDIRLNSTAQSVAAIGTYECSGEAINYDKSNMDVRVRSTEVMVQALPVYVEVKFDGKVDIPSTVSAGTTHTFTAAYVDIYGKTQNADVKLLLMSDDNEVAETINDGSIYKKGTYRIVVSIADANYAVSDANYLDDTLMLNFKIVQGKLNLAMGVNVVEYNGGKGIEYNAGIPSNISSQLFDKDKLTYIYYPYFEGAKYDPISNKISGNTWDRESPMAEKPSQVGLYHVEVIYEGNDSFIANEYSGDLQIVKATTIIDAPGTVSYSYDIDDETQLPYRRTYDLVKAQLKVYSTTAAREVLFDYNDKNADYSLINIKYRYDNTWIDVNEDAEDEGWYTQMGSYRFLVQYLGDDSHEPCELSVTMRITAAEFKNIDIEDVEGTYDGKTNFATKLSPVGLGQYPLAKVTYEYNRETYDSLSKITILNAGTHTVTMTVSQEGFETKAYTATVQVNAAKIVGITAIPVVATYDGQRHSVTFKGFDTVGGKNKYNGLDVIILPQSGYSEEGTLYATKAGNYIGKVKISVLNHEDLILDTIIQIDAAEIEVTEASINIPDGKLPSGVKVDDDTYYGYYKQGDKETYVPLKFRNEKGEIVTPNSSGVLADGKYTVELNVGDNYYINYKWDLVVGNINAKELTVSGIIAVVVTAVVMVAAIVTSVIVVNNRKKNEVMD